MCQARGIPESLTFDMLPAAAVRTEVFETFAQQHSKSVEAIMESFAPFHAMDRVGDPNEIAAAVVFLASEASRYVTGQQLRIDAGSLLKFPNGPG